MDYLLNIYRNKKYIGTVGGSHMAYDNVLWWEIKDIINLKNLDDEKLINKIVDRSSYWKKVISNAPIIGAAEIDLGMQTIHMEYLLDFSSLDKIDSCIKITKKNDTYFATYEDGDSYEVPKIYFKNENLLFKRKLSFEEFNEIYKLINHCLDVLNDNDFIVNESKLLKLSII